METRGSGQKEEPLVSVYALRHRKIGFDHCVLLPGSLCEKQVEGLNMNSLRFCFFLVSFLLGSSVFVQVASQDTMPEEVMQRIYEEIKTPYKYGLVLIPGDSGKMVDSPSVFRHGHSWYMTYIVFDGRGYETWLAHSDNLLNWKTLGRIISFTGSLPFIRRCKLL